MKSFNDELALIKEKDKLAVAQMKQNKMSNNTNLNKENSNWLFSSYKLCFSAKTFYQYRLLLPTALIRLECDGPFRALLDTGAQPNLISHTLFKKLTCLATQSTKRLIGVASKPFAITKEMNVIIRPWFDSNVYVNDKM